MKLSKLRASTSTRQLAGQTIPRQNTTSFGMRAALKKGGSGYAGESGDVGGNPAKMHLARARRHGGRVNRADGGPAGGAGGGGGKEERMPRSGFVPNSGRRGGDGSVDKTKEPFHAIAPPPAMAAALTSTLTNPAMLASIQASQSAREAADKFSQNRRGLAAEGAEDRAKGGSVKKKKGC